MSRRTAILLLVTLPAPAQPGAARWQWPLRPPVTVVRGFLPPAHPWEAGHRGVDLAARPGARVLAAGRGRVGYAGDLAGRGVVTIVHGALRTTYLPVRPTVRTGQVVAAGARIGVVGDDPAHCGPRPCLHWGLLRGVSYLDPLSLLGLGPVRLLPRWHATPGADGPGADMPEADRPPPVSAEGAGARPVGGSGTPPPGANRGRAAPAADRHRERGDATAPARLMGAAMSAGPAVLPALAAALALLATRVRVRHRPRTPRPARCRPP